MGHRGSMQGEATGRGKVGSRDSGDIEPRRMDEVTSARRGCGRPGAWGGATCLPRRWPGPRDKACAGPRLCPGRRLGQPSPRAQGPPTACVQAGPEHPAGSGRAECHGPPRPRPSMDLTGEAQERQQKARPLSAPHATRPPNHSAVGALLVMGVRTPGSTLTSPSNPLCHSDHRYATATTQPSHPEKNVDLGLELSTSKWIQV